MKFPTCNRNLADDLIRFYFFIALIFIFAAIIDLLFKESFYVVILVAGAAITVFFVCIVVFLLFRFTEQFHRHIGSSPRTKCKMGLLIGLGGSFIAAIIPRIMVFIDEMVFVNSVLICLTFIFCFYYIFVFQFKENCATIYCLWKPSLWCILILHISLLVAIIITHMLILGKI